MSDVSGLQVGLSGLAAQRRALEVAGQNIANASTEGYHRQVAQLQALGGPVLPAFWSHSDGVGQGVTVSGVSRSYDQFLESQALAQHAGSALLSGNQRVLANVEGLIGEPGDTGLQAQMSAFWSSWQDVSNSPSDLAARTALLQRGQTLAGGFSQVASGLSTLWSSSRTQLDAVVADASGNAAQVAALNAQIRIATQGGGSPNDLTDRRDQLVQKLSEQLGATARPGADGTVDVYLGGSALVRGDTARTLTVSGPGNPSAMPSPSGPATVTLSWADDGSPVGAGGGHAGALVEAVNVTVPTWLGRLDAVAASLASQVNAQHAAGYDLNGTSGGTFFTGSTAATLAVALTDPRTVAASAQPPGAGPPLVPSYDGTNALDLGQLGGAATSPDSAYRSLVTDLGVAAQTANSRATVQQQLTTQADSAREASSGVSIDEETTSLIRYQRAYEASARYLSVVDSTLNTLINHMGA
jgi:flagellar hook-associated protein 1 FlgK